VPRVDCKEAGMSEGGSPDSAGRAPLSCAAMAESDGCLGPRRGGQGCPRSWRPSMMSLPHDSFHWPKFIPTCITIPRYILFSSSGVDLFSEIFQVCTIVSGMDGTRYAAELLEEHAKNVSRGEALDRFERRTH
jgi:hypothetical protein